MGLALTLGKETIECTTETFVAQATRQTRTLVVRHAAGVVVAPTVQRKKPVPSWVEPKD